MCKIDLRKYPTFPLSGLNAGYLIYPNPTSGKVFIDGLGIESMISVFDVFGNEIFEIQNTMENSVDLSSQPKGIYFIKIESETQNHIERVILN